MQVSCTKSGMFAFVLMKALIVSSKMKFRYKARLININDFLHETGMSVAEANLENGFTGRPENHIAKQKICFPILPRWHCNPCLGVWMVQACLFSSVIPIEQLKNRLMHVEII